MNHSNHLKIRLNVNDVSYSLHLTPQRTLLEVLREDLGLTGSKRGCNQGVCGACNVMVDGEVRRSCISLACTVTDTRITTVEGLERNGKLDPVQQAFVDQGAIQCGYCMSGMVISAQALLIKNPNP